ncbi:MAG: Eco57I restriction-modification methylase domain-containing protein, partial [Chloroflexi bacterium]|nr:Eco57I restriction-modification methylase domain-containing protein [Chloroflexota bacterium]
NPDSSNSTKSVGGISNPDSSNSTKSVGGISNPDLATNPDLSNKTCFLDNLLSESERYARELGERLKGRVFEEIFPHFARGFIIYARRNNLLPANFDSLTGEERAKQLEPFFGGTLTFLYRLLFLFYAESRDLLPVREVRGYYEKSLEKLKRQIAEKAGTIEDEAPINIKAKYNDLSTAFYDTLQELFQAVDRGDPSLNVPVYNGGLFVTEPDPQDLSPEAGAARFLSKYKIPDRELALGLDRMARDIDEKRHDLAFIDYKSLGVRQLGSIYEGLLEFKLRVASETLVVVKGKKTEELVPEAEAREKKLTVLKEGRGKDAHDRTLPKGSVYLENDRRERKATGSYYTPDYIVKYIVENTVGPVLKEKLEALRPAFRRAEESLQAERKKYEALKKQGRTGAGGDSPENQAYLKHQDKVNEPFFDLKVLDPAMGSGHFLVEAVDYITDRMADFLSQFRWNPVVHELTQTRRQIQGEMERQGVSVNAGKLTDINLLKRQVLKRCIYGVDLNPMAVELAKVSLWLDCFTLGAPLSFLDHHMKAGNSLIGGQVQEVQDALSRDLFGNQFAGLLSATSLMQEVGKLSDITVAQVSASRSTYRQAYDALAPFKRLLDVWISKHFDNKGAQNTASLYAGAIVANDYGKTNLVDRKAIETALTLSRAKRFFHWELEFPEVFYNETQRKPEGGFDAVIGNPPYVRVQEIPHLDIDFFKINFSTSHKRIDISILFFETSLKLLSTKGLCAYISSIQFLSAEYGRALRTLLRNNTIYSLIDFKSLPVFDGATTYPGIIVFSLGQPSPFSFFEITQLPSSSRERLTLPTGFKIHPIKLSDESWELVNDFSQSILKKIYNPERVIALSECAETWGGVITGKDEIFNLDKETLDRWNIESDLVLPLIRGTDVDGWWTNPSMWLLYPYKQTFNGDTQLIPEAELKQNYPNAYAYLKIHEQELKARKDSRNEVGNAKDWYKILRFGSLYLFTSRKILTPGESIKNSFAIDSSGSAFSFARVYAVIAKTIDTGFLTTILNSSVLEFALHSICPLKRGGYYTYSSTYLANTPIRRINFTTPEKERAGLVEELKEKYLAKDEAGVLAQVSICLPTNSAGEQNTANEKSDVIHDLLAFLAEEMIRLNQEKRAVQKEFLDWLITTVKVQPDKEGKTGLDVLVGKAKLSDFPGDYQKGEPHLSTDEVLDILQKNKGKLGVRLSDTAALPNQIKTRYTAALEHALPLKERLAQTDRLIDQIVYRLYGLTEDEIKVVEGRGV